MKVCKKCKTHVANKAKICKKCGSDVSKAKIIKNVSSTKKQNNTKSQIKTKTIKKDVKPIVETKSKKQNKVVVTNKLNKKNNNKKAERYAIVNDVLKKILNIIKICINYLIKIIRKALLYIVQELFQSLKITAMITSDLTKSIVVAIISIAKKSAYVTKKIPSYLKTIYSKYKEGKVRKIKKQKEAKQEIKKVETMKSSRKNKSLKFAFFTISILSITSGIYLVSLDIYHDLNGNTKKVVVTEKATREKVFDMNDIITYNSIDYKVVKIETSKGNNYKSPKAGHQFLIVTVYIKNNTGKKVPYSYENWTMSNSKGEEKKRIFSSINVDTALYSGELVIGGIKTGSMVFEQPINDPKLKMNFYELKKDEDGNEVIDEAKRIFSISVKVPNKKNKENNDKSTNDDVKVVKTNTKNENY